MGTVARTIGLRLTTPAVFAVAVVGAVAAGALNVALSWDGSYYLFNVLESGQPFTPHQRLVNAITQGPTLLAQHFTDRMDVLRLVFGVSYMILPIIALLACFVVVRRRPAMFVWAVIGICLATLPGQVNASSEAIQVAQMIWPLLLAAIVGLDSRDWVAWVAVVATGLFTAMGHPFGVPLLGLALVVSLLYRRRSVAAVAAVLLAISAVNAWATLDVYQTDRITMDVVRTSYAGAIFGAPIVAMVGTFLGALLISLAGRPGRGARFGAAGLACLVLGIAVLMPWAHNPVAWGDAIDFRTFAPAAIVPLALVAVFDGWPGRAGGTESGGDSQDALPWRRAAALTAAAGFALILVIQGISIQRLDRSLADAERAAPGTCVAQSSVGGIGLTVLDHWATTPRSLIFGNRAPTKIVMPGIGCSLLIVGTVYIASWDMRSVDVPGWFDLRGLAASPPPASGSGPAVALTP